MRTFSTIIASSTPIGRYLISRLSLRRSHAISVKPQASTPPMAAADASNEESLRRTLAEKQSAVDAQGNAVRALKAAKASKSEIDAAIESLNRLKLEKSSVERELQSVVSGSGGGASVNREAFRQTVFNTLERRLFFIPSFKIYRGVAGLYDYGPPGCAVKSNVLAFWRQHFVLEEDMLEVDCPCVTPEAVLKASGHVEKFTDLMVKDEKMGTCYRADHLLKDFGNEKLEKDLSLSAEKAAELRHLLAVLDDLSAEELGAKIKEYGITAPDTKNPLSDPYPFNLMFQTSIGPSGLIPGYMRPETAQGIFVNFKDLYYYNGNKLPFAAAQIGQAFRNEGIVNNETLGYFIGRVYLFLTCLGIDKERLRFRQHLANEMAHYAADCWDAEIECSYGWIECVGIADRSAYDLHAHTKELFLHSRSQQECGEAFGRLMNEKEKLWMMKAHWNRKGRWISKEKKKEHHLRVFTASSHLLALVELYTASMSTLSIQGQVKLGMNSLNVFRFPPSCGTYKCTLSFPLVQNQQYEEVAKVISTLLKVAGISHKIDITGTSIGKRYARTDELGVPFAITVDSTSSVTIRERDSKDQIRVSLDEAASVIKAVTDGQTKWEDVWSSYPHHSSESADD
ncbi:hypothetical protein CUMW_175990 [Citrus unshiu]|uniref:WHEP-TRS domain-containing protein n=1 Tax=Citrus unshiu TaxID=55188 RepID=A0A2H5PXB0_CITUN|nr:hypothetical protein CUMW_175990 [Citrus unshiu]